MGLNKKRSECLVLLVGFQKQKAKELSMKAAEKHIPLSALHPPEVNEEDTLHVYFYSTESG